jgi:hypothetical protein
MTGTAVSVRLIAVDHARAERPGLHQVQWDVFGDRRQKRRAATNDDWIAEDAQLVDEAELERRRGQVGAADRDILVGRVEHRSRGRSPLSSTHETTPIVVGSPSDRTATAAAAGRSRRRTANRDAFQAEPLSHLEVDELPKTGDP